MNVPKNILKYCDELERVVHTDEPLSQRHIAMLTEHYAWLEEYFAFREDNPYPHDEPTTNIETISNQIVEAWNERRGN